MNHTPGPWNRGYGNHVYEGVHCPPLLGRLIAVCEPTTKTPEDWDETFANARLIASSPDMLALLKQFVSMLPSDEGLGGHSTMLGFIVFGHKVKALIGKVEGACP